MALITEIRVEVDLTAPKGAPTELQNQNGTTDIADVYSAVRLIPPDVDNLLQQQKSKFLTNLPEILDKELTNASPSAQDKIITGPTITFSTLNVRSIHNTVKSSQAIDLFRILDHDFVGLTETRHKTQKELYLRHKNDNTYTAFWNIPNHHFDGVGFLVKNK